MQALLQRVSKASVKVDEQIVGQIEQGLVAFIGVGLEDGADDAAYLADKIAGLRIFSDEEEKMNLSVLDIGGAVLVVSQFTLMASTRKGRRPSFTQAAPPQIAEPLVERFADYLRRAGVKVETGRFQAHMLVEIHNDGPVTISIDSLDRFKPRK